MLKERNVFAEELPVNVVTAKIDEYSRHFHDDIEIIYVISGKISVQNGYYRYELSQGDITIINEKEIHSFEKISENNMVMMVRINLEYFETYYKNLRNSFFMIHDKKSEKAYIQAMREILAAMMMDILKKGYGYEQKVIENAHNLVTCMLANFQMDLGESSDDSDAKSTGKRILTIRLRRIMDYMYENYKTRITLEEIADLEHLSIYYLSHIIKEATGLSFQDLLSFIRVDESEVMLLSTEKKIGAISKEVGFSALRYYKKHFEQWFGCEPSEYRQLAKSGQLKKISNAKYTMCNAHEIEDAIKRSTKSVYSDYINAKKHAPIIVALDFGKDITAKGEISFIGDLMHGENLRFIERPYGLFKSLNEQIGGSGMNYIISFTGDENINDIDRVTILLYNIGEDEKRDLIMAEKKEQILDICTKNDDAHEFLIKLKNITGSFEITRYKLSRENIVAAYRELIRASGIAERRRSLLSNWETIPNIERGTVSAVDNLNLRSTMTGISVEMILLDRIK